MDLLDNFKDLELFCEGGEPVVEYMGKFYRVDQCDGESVPIETGVKTSIRRCVGYPDRLSSVPLHESVGDRLHYGTLSGSDECFLPDSSRCFYRVVMNPDKVFFDGLPECVSLIDGRVYCYKGVCGYCDRVSECVVSVEESDVVYSVVSLDISAQEPVFSALESGEPMLLSTFRNRHLRDKGLTQYLESAYQVYTGLDANDIMVSRSWWSWLDSFHHNITELVEYNRLVQDYMSSPTDESRAVLLKRTNEFMQKYFEFRDNKS